MFALPRTLYDQIIDHARETYPEECCGLIAGNGGTPSHIYRLKNTAETPTTRYLIDPQQQIWAFKNMRHNGMDLVAIYHSHPESEAYPSQTDLSLAYYPEAVYLLATLRDLNRPAVRAYRIVDGRISEIDLKISD